MEHTERDEEREEENNWRFWGDEMPFEYEDESKPQKKIVVETSLPKSIQPNKKVEDIEFMSRAEPSKKTESYRGKDSSSSHSSERSSSANTNFTEEVRRIAHVLGSTVDTKFSCQKQIIKHILFESLINERLCSKRYHVLPTTCKNLVQIYLRESLGWNFPLQASSFLCKESEKISFIELKNMLIEQMDSSRRQVYMRFLALAFCAECYMYGVSKKISKTQNDNHPSWEFLCLTVYSALAQSGGVPSILSRDKFKSLMLQLRNYQLPENIQSLLDALPPPFLQKLRTIPADTLKVFYKLKIKKMLSATFNGCSSTSEIVDKMINLPEKLDLFSNYSGHLNLPRPTKYIVFTL